ncbi:MAG: threonine--tRNA ligase [Candidatus Parcubacteria bacterium]|nr:threonine--tRNA ligase [Candidatus Parcubacteria bacterium]
MEKTDQLYKIRHSLAHLLAIAVLEHDPNAKLTIGPVVDNGFYYDVDFSDEKAPTPEDLKKIQKTMKKLAGRKLPFTKRTLTDDEAKKMFADNPYKMELIEGIIKEGEKATVYDTGDFTDLCEGPHVENTGEIDTDAFKIDHIAGAYWRGNEKNKMLTRIYGLAFETGKDLDDYLKMIEEAKKRDHRKLGKELDLFTFSDLVGPGLPLWTPKGTVLRETLDGFVRELREAHGYKRVTIPHITKKALYETSGHWAKFSEELFKITTREGKEYAMKPMNCPHHTQIFARTQWSYRDMPQRYAETTMVYRDEQSGELGGLTRVLSITQDDAHVFARPNQIKEEFFAIWDIINTVYETFGFELRVRLSFHNPEAFEKYLGTKEVWEKAENAIREIAKERNANYFEAPGEAAMYGPKLDFMAKDSLGREHQVATIQLDMNGIRTEFHNESETLGKKIRTGKLQKIPYLLVIGDKEVADRTVTIEARGEETKGAVPLSELLENLK